MNLDELKAKNEEEAKKALPPEDDTVVDDDVIEDDDTVVEDEVDDDPEKKVLEPWQETDDQTSNGVPVETHIKVKKKLKGRISERDDEIQRLTAENDALKSQGTKAPTGDTPVVPKLDDFDDEEDYAKALDKYHSDMFAASEGKRDAKRQRQDRQKVLTQAVDSHYERAGKLVETSGIDPEVYKQSDSTVRQAIEAIIPKMGDAIADQLISVLGEGSEKVMYFLGRNKEALTTAKSLMAEDKSGLKLAAYLGQQKERLTNPIKRKSKAPAPAPIANGDASGGTAGRAEHKKYTAAMKKGGGQVAYNIKKAAKKSGVDVSDW